MKFVPKCLFVFFFKKITLFIYSTGISTGISPGILFKDSRGISLEVLSEISLGGSGTGTSLRRFLPVLLSGCSQRFSGLIPTFFYEIPFWKFCMSFRRYFGVLPVISVRGFFFSSFYRSCFQVFLQWSSWDFFLLLSREHSHTSLSGIANANRPGILDAPFGISLIVAPDILTISFISRRV